MNHRKLIYSLIFILLAFSLILAGIIFHLENQKLQVVFFAVGQGDAILVSKGSNQVLIDGGPSGKVELEKLGKYVPFWDRKIEVVIATHPDKDHILGLTEVMENYKIGAVIDNGMKNDSAVFQKYLDTINRKNIKRLEGKEQMKIKFGEAEMEILYPQGNLENTFADTNTKSIVAKLVFGKNSFLFAGDLPGEREVEILGKDIKADILKVAHHGSKNSTGDDFLEKIAPRDAIISVGKNSYGHPTPEVLEKLKNKNIKILRTDELGDIEYICDNVEVNCYVK